MSIGILGWNDTFEQAFAPYRAEGYCPARILREEKERYLAYDGNREIRAEISGRLRHRARSRSDFPAVGDWVALEPTGTDDLGVIHAILPRTSLFCRKAAGEAVEEQVVAANIDTVFIVMDLERDFNPRRIERYLTLTWESGAKPVILLTKADLAGEIEAAVAEIEAIAMDVPVHAISSVTGTGLDELGRYLQTGITVALLGSSGAGKSTLINALLGEDRLITRQVKDDGRGRHTTTWRELILLPSGAVAIDTPGMKEIGLWADGSGFESSFREVEQLARNCRFADCTHTTEPDCAVLAALGDGSLASDRLDSYRKLQKELRYLERKENRLAMLAEKNRWKRIHMSMRRNGKQR